MCVYRLMSFMKKFGHENESIPLLLFLKTNSSLRSFSRARENGSEGDYGRCIPFFFFLISIFFPSEAVRV